MSRSSSALALLVAAAAAAARAAPPGPAGDYDSPLGRVRVTGDGASFTGTLVAPAGPCAFPAGAEVLRGTLLDDSLAGQVRVCLRGPGCGAEAWAGAVLLVAPGGLTGAAHVKAGCQAPLGKSGGLAFTRVEPGPGAAAAGARPPPPRPAAPPGAQAARARALIAEGARWLQEGSFERARERFQAAIAVDPRLPEAFNGVGVTYRMRHDLPRAMTWYKRSLAVDPDFGDAYYNMACLYALQGQPALALRYLQIAAVNGFATAGVIERDDDLASLRQLPAYQALVRAGP